MDAAMIEGRHESGIYAKRGLTLVAGSGARVTDEEGRTYLDCIGGHGVASVGHANPDVVAAIQEQANRLITCPGSFHNDVRARYIERLLGRFPRSFRRVFLCNSGTEAVEGALKIARYHTGRTGFVAAKRGFHGRTFGALSVTWNHRQGFEPLVPGVRHVPFGDPAALEAAIDHDTAALILEVVQGEGGVHVAPAGYLARAEAICRERGALLVIDEVQTGFARIGEWFAFQRDGIEPDLVCLAKAMGGGVPMGAVVMTEALGALRPGVHGSTFGGNPLACAAASAVLDYLEKEQMPETVRRRGAKLFEHLRAIDAPVIRDVRGLGLMVGIELRTRVTPFLKALQDRGILALAAGPTVLRLLPPLVISESELDEVVAGISAVLKGAGV